MTKKGKLEEIFSKAQFADDPKTYKVVYRDFEKLRKISMPEFLKESNNFQTIPSNRIELITKNNRVLFRKTKKWVD